MQVEAAQRVMGSGSVEWNLVQWSREHGAEGDLPIPVWKLEVSRGRLCLRGWCQDPAGGVGVLLGLSSGCGVCICSSWGEGGTLGPSADLLIRVLVHISPFGGPLYRGGEPGLPEQGRQGLALHCHCRTPGPGVGVAHPP